MTRTLFDLTLLISQDALVCAIDAALHRDMVTMQELDAFAAAHSGWRGVRRFRRALELADGRAESPHETLTRLLLKPGWEGLQPQVLLRDRYGTIVARFDHADEEIKLAIESDGKRFHRGDVMVASDRRRDRASEAQGYLTERVTWFEVRRQPERTRQRVFALAAARRHRFAA